jgi:hypothetical protein
MILCRRFKKSLKGVEILSWFVRQSQIDRNNISSHDLAKRYFHLKGPIVLIEPCQRGNVKDFLSSPAGFIFLEPPQGVL